MKIIKEVIINKNIESAWNVLGHQFAEAYKWASPVNHSEGKGSSYNGATCSERGCDIVGMGKTKEKLLQFSNEKHLLSYSIPEGMPSMVKYATNTWQLTALGNDKSRLNMQIDITLGGIMGMIMKPMMKLMMSKMSSTLADDFKYYIEKGEPHPRKIKATSKYRIK